jgi:hypothetical protein
MGASRGDQVDDVLAEWRGDMHLPHRADEGADLGGIDDGDEIIQRR